ncbi:unnamed protein product [Pleuronectes platessa]|uniref:Uncharacterized protein n=1 Tax=Pleuronectes platessa TaxID=8262 RepID=A0A9N7V7B5_PLEPL|nr:unnamed protein product [Pleuronectes platessa]
MAWGMKLSLSLVVRARMLEMREEQEDGEDKGGGGKTWRKGLHAERKSEISTLSVRVELLRRWRTESWKQRNTSRSSCMGVTRTQGMADVCGHVLSENSVIPVLILFCGVLSVRPGEECEEWLRRDTETHHLGHARAECHLPLAHASPASTQSSVSRRGGAAGALCTGVPTLKGTGGHGHLSCLFSQHSAQGGQAGPGPSPLNSTGQLLSPWPNNGHCYHCLATQTRAGTGPVLIKDPVTLTLAIRELAFMETIERKMGLSLPLSSFPAHFPILNSSPSFCPLAHLDLM